MSDLILRQWQNSQTSYRSLGLLAVPPVAASFVVLALAAVGRAVWLIHLSAIALACCIALAGSYLGRPGNRQITALTLIILTMIGLAIPLSGNSAGPERWVALGPLRLYVAPVLLPAFIAACSVFAGKDGKGQMVSFFALLGVAVLLAAQPDASQLLGLLAATAVVVVRYKLATRQSVMILVPLGLITIWGFSLPDPLEPVPHVEGVFALALEYSLFVGVAVIASAAVLVVGLWIQSQNGPLWLSAVAVYYMMLFACSTAGLTPAPLVGYGAGPILGFGLMAGLLRRLET